MIIATPTLDGPAVANTWPSKPRRIAACYFVYRQAQISDLNISEELAYGSSSVCVSECGSDSCSLGDITAGKLLADAIGSSGPIIPGLSFAQIESFKKKILEDGDSFDKLRNSSTTGLHYNGERIDRIDASWLLFAYLAEAYRQISTGSMYGISPNGVYDKSENTIQVEVVSESAITTTSTPVAACSITPPKKSFYARNKKLIWIICGLFGIGFVGGVIYYVRRKKRTY